MTLLHIFIKISNDTFSFFTIVANIITVKVNNRMDVLLKIIDSNLFHLFENFIDSRIKYIQAGNYVTSSEIDRI